MANIDDLKTRYFVDAGDARLPSEPVPETFSESKITPLIDCAVYNSEIREMLGKLGRNPRPENNSKDFIYIANWWLGLAGGEYTPVANVPSDIGQQVVANVDASPYCLDGPTSHCNNILSEILKEKARLGVDVRVLGWVSTSIMHSEYAQENGAASLARVNSLTIESIQELRQAKQDPSAPTWTDFAEKVLINTIDHNAGSAHVKMVVAGTKAEAIGFTGGLDFQMDRWAHSQHTGNERWHDVVAKVQGPAVQGLFNFFKEMWNEIISRPVVEFLFESQQVPNYFDSSSKTPPPTPVISERELPLVAEGKHHVQSLRTVPQFNYKTLNIMGEKDPISFAMDGLFEIKLALKKAIENAQQYIYMEDQQFWSQEVLGWVNGAIASNVNLRVILLTSGFKDPNDPDFPDAILSNSINHGLLLNLLPSQLQQVRMYARLGDLHMVQAMQVDAVFSSGGGRYDFLTNLVSSEEIKKDQLVKSGWFVVQGLNYFKITKHARIPPGTPIRVTVQHVLGSTPPSLGAYVLAVEGGITVHSKTTLIDDQWALIGSANISRNSLYTSLEHCVSFLDEDEIVVREYRKELWAEHFRHSNPEDFDDIEAALNAWESTWGSSGTAPPRSELLVRQIRLPISPDEPLVGDTKQEYDLYHDVDSRDDWGGLCP